MSTTRKRVGKIDDAIGYEISLVDRPANSLATINHVEIAKRAAEPVIVKADSDTLESSPEEKGLFKRFAAWLRKESGQGGHLVTDKDGTKHLPTTTDGKPDHRLMGAAWAALHGGYRGNKYEGPDKSKAIAALTALYEREGLTKPGDKKSAKADRLSKGLYDVGCLAQMVQQLDYLAESAEDEREQEGDSSDIPDRLRAACSLVGQILIDMAQEEVGELNDSEGAEKMAGEMTVERLLDIVRKDNADKAAAGNGLEKAGRKMSAENMGHLEDMSKAMDKAAGFLNKAAKDHPDDENLANGIAHHMAAQGHMKMLDMGGPNNGPSDEQVNGGRKDKSPADMKDAAAAIDDLKKSLSEDFGKQIGEFRNELTKMAAENSNLKIENATLKGEVKALGNLPMAPKAALFATALRGAEAAKAAGADDGAAVVIDPKDPNAFSKAYASRVLPKPNSIMDPKFNGSMANGGVK